MSERFTDLKTIMNERFYFDTIGRTIGDNQEKEFLNGFQVAGLLNTYEDLLAEMSGTIDGLEVEVKRLNDKYTDEYAMNETLRLEVQRLESKNKQLNADYEQLQEEWISSDKEVERLKEELRLALN